MPIKKYVRAESNFCAVIARLPLVIIALIFASPLLLLSSQIQAVIALALVAIFGISHGASDHLLASPSWERYFRQYWLLAFIIVYIGLIILVFAMWTVAPAVTLLGFLCLAALHFAIDDMPEPITRQFLPEVIGRGLLPVSGAALLHGIELTEIITSLLDNADIATKFVIAMTVTALIALSANVIAIIIRMHSAELYLAMELIATVVALVVFPPVLGFALYFCFVHARRQVHLRCKRFGTSVVEYHTTYAPFIIGGIAALSLSFILGIEAGALVIAGLAALTVPHMLLLDRGAKVPSA